MVEKMKKYNFLIYHKTYDDFLESIRQAGVVHILEKRSGCPDDAIELRRHMAESDKLKNTVFSLQRRLDGQPNATLLPADPSSDGSEALKAHERLKTREEYLLQQQTNLRKEIDNMTVWGNFEPETVKKIADSGRDIRFYTCRESEFLPAWRDRFNAMEIARHGAVIYFVTITPVGSKGRPDAESVRISDRSLNDLLEAQKENKRQREELGKRMDALAVEQLNNLKEAYRQMLGNIDIDHVNLHSEKKAGDKLILLEGWVPAAREADLVRALETQDACYFSKTPDPTDNAAPVLLKNNRFARLFEPISNLYDLPNYHAMDLTPFFAPFYLLFFGLCLADTGYGILVLIAALVARKKLSPSLKPVMSLAALLGIATIICGMISGGTLFGIPLIDMEWAWLASLKTIMLNSEQMFSLALILGGVQILFGMIIKAIGKVIRYGWAYSLETWGWVILIVGGVVWYFATDRAMLSPEAANYLLYAILGVSGILILLLNTPGRNPLINFFAGLYNSYNMLTGLMGDVLSYIRLFALGLCGGVMGLVFNDLAIQASGDIPVVSHIFMILIMLIGHSINLFMSSIGAFVHPLRLTFVEFYKNAGYEGGGKMYKPLKIRTVED